MSRSSWLQHLAVWLVVITTGFNAWAQQEASLIHYWQTETRYNPAAVGRQPELNINAVVQTHASGYKDAGSTMYAGADMAFQLGKTRHGVGAMFQNDAIGLFAHKRFAILYAYHLKLWGGTLSAGASADMMNEAINGSKADLGDANDPAFPTTDLTGSKFDASFGLYYAHKRWWTGVSALHLTAPTVKMGETNEYRIKRAYFLTGGYNIPWPRTFYTIVPSVLLSYDGTGFRSDITARVIYSHDRKRLYGGLNYSPQHSVAGFVGGMFHGVELSYAYEAYTSGMGLGAGQHEVSIRYCLPVDLGKKGRNVHRSVRWL